jgi:hypothetical protein
MEAPQNLELQRPGRVTIDLLQAYSLLEMMTRWLGYVFGLWVKSAWDKVAVQ